MKLYTDSPCFYNDISESIRAYIEVDLIELVGSREGADICVFTDSTVPYAKAVLSTGGEHEVALKYESSDEIEKKRIFKRAVKLSVYYLLKNACGRELPWGSLTGIRPTKLVREYSKYGNIQNVLKRMYDLPKEKTRLLEEICRVQEPFYYPESDEIDIYIGIPFCLSRCVYCSFSTPDSLKGKTLAKPYVEALFFEMSEAKKLIEQTGRRVRCVYVGGGTPTALNETLFSALMEQISDNFAPSLEFTVEAGRPDTITRAKLEAMKKSGVGRISINPQSMNEETLKLIGRMHSPQDIVECFALARDVGFNTINADLIAGLPGENEEMFKNTMSGILELKPENVTVHTLALKRGSIMLEKGIKPVAASEVGKMVAFALKTLQTHGYMPYYLYRQKYMTGSFENIGYTLTGHEGIYNIDIMEETTDILALGAGAVSKRILGGGRIERAFNIKSISEYVMRVDEMNERRRELFGAELN